MWVMVSNMNTLGDSSKWFGDEDCCIPVDLFLVVLNLLELWETCLSQSFKDRSVERPPRTYSATTRTERATVLAEPVG